MAGFAKALTALPRQDVRAFMAALSADEQLAARRALEQTLSSEVDEPSHLRLMQANVVLTLAEVPGVTLAAAMDLIWTADQTTDTDPRDLLARSEGWRAHLEGPARDLLDLARGVQMKLLAMSAPEQEARSLRAAVLETTSAILAGTPPTPVRTDAQFLEACVRTDRASAGLSADALDDLTRAIALYEDLRAQWPLATQPRDHIMVLSNLGSCFKARAGLGRGAGSTSDIAHAIDLLTETVRLASARDDTETASMAQFKLAVIHFQKADRETGAERDTSLTAAIDSFAALREIWKGEDTRGSRVKALVNQAVVTSHRGGLRTARAGLRDFEAAAGLCAEAIETFRAPGDEGDLGRAWGHRGSAHWYMARRKTGAEARADLERALACHREGEQIWHRLGATTERANCLMDQGIVLSTMGEAHIGAETLRYMDRGIALFTQAYDIKHDMGDTLGAARVARNLGTVWSKRADRVAGAEAREALTEAIAAYDKTAEVYDPETDIGILADIGGEKGAALLTRAQHLTGAAQRADLDAAIALLEAARAVLEMPQDARQIASAAFNCGLAYAQRAKALPWDPAAPVDPASQDATRAIACFDQALEIFDAPEDAVDAFDPQIALAELLTWQAVHGAPDADARALLAIQMAKRACATYDPLIAPRDWLRAAETLGQALFVAGDPGAEAALQEVLAQGVRLVVSLPDPEGQETALRTLSGVGDRLAMVRARAGDLAGALAAVGQGRSVRATRDRALEGAGAALAELRTILFEARANVMMLTETQEDAGTADPETTHALQVARGHLTASQAALDVALGTHPTGAQMRGQVDLADIAATLGPRDTLAVPLVAETGGGVLLVTQQAGAASLAFLPLPELTAHRLAQVLGTPGRGWMEVYASTFADTSLQVWDPASESAQAFSAALEDLLGALWRLLMGPLHLALYGALTARGAGAGSAGILGLIPPGKMAGLPLGAARPEPEASPFLSDWPVAYSQSLSAWVTAHAQAAERESGPVRLLAVSDPTEDLAVARAYARVGDTWQFAPKRIASGPPERLPEWEAPGWAQVPPAQRRELAHRAATVPAVSGALAEATHAVFFCHGGWDRDRGTGSGLMMAAPKAPDPADAPAQRWPGEMMTLERLDAEGADLTRLRMCVLAACETAPVGLLLPDEFTGLAHALSLRVPMVVSTLFPVTPGATTLLLRATLGLHLGAARLALPVALARAQHAAARGGEEALRYIVTRGRCHPDPADLYARLQDTRPRAAPVPVPIARAGGGDGPVMHTLDATAPVLDRAPFYWAAFVAIGAGPAPD
jgi:tetratricopeptide (TPR) repeat protein